MFSLPHSVRPSHSHKSLSGLLHLQHGVRALAGPLPLFCLTGVAVEVFWVEGLVHGSDALLIVCTRCLQNIARYSSVFSVHTVSDKYVKILYTSIMRTQ